MSSLRELMADADVFGLSVVFRRLRARGSDGVVELRTRIGPLFIRPFDSDMKIFRSIFVKRQYDMTRFAQNARVIDAYNAIRAQGRRPVILDAGANIGAASLWFARQFPEARIIAVEPDHANASLCRRNTAACANVTVVEAAIGSSPGRATIRTSAYDSKSWALQTSRSADGEVPIVTVDDLMAGEGEGAQLFLAKIDIEGAEGDLFSANLDWLSTAAVVIIELHDPMTAGQYNSMTFLRAMSRSDWEILLLDENLMFVR